MSEYASQTFSDRQDYDLRAHDIRSTRPTVPLLLIDNDGIALVEPIPWGTVKWPVGYWWPEQIAAAFRRIRNIIELVEKLDRD